MIINQMKEDLFNGRQSITNYPLFLIKILLLLFFKLKTKDLKKEKKALLVSAGQCDEVSISNWTLLAKREKLARIGTQTNGGESLGKRQKKEEKIFLTSCPFVTSTQPEPQTTPLRPIMAQLRICVTIAVVSVSVLKTKTRQR